MNATLRTLFAGSTLGGYARFGILLGLAALVVGTPTAHAGSPPSANLTFVNNTGLADSDIYITFATPAGGGASSFNITYNGGTSISRNNTNGVATSSIALANVTGSNFTLNNYTIGGTFYVSYGGPLDTSTNPSPLNNGNAQNFNTRWQQIELTYLNGPSSTGSNGDFTGVNVISNSIFIQNYNNGTPNRFTGFSSNILSGGLMRGLYNSLNASGEVDSTNGDLNQNVVINSGNLVRIVSPSSYGIPAGNYSIGPYHSFSNYVGSLLTENGGGVQNTTLHNYFQTKGQTFNGTTYGNLSYDMSFVATPVSGNTFVINGNIRVGNLDNANAQVANITGLTINLPTDTATSKELSYLIYQEPYPFTANTTFSANWTSANFSSSDLQLAQQNILGDLQEGILTGLVGSNTTYFGSNTTYNGTAIKDVPSSAWWSYNGTLFSNLQTNPNFYSTYSAYVLPAGFVYSAPYDDRFPGANNPDIPLDTQWVITLNGDGSFSTVPEPATYGLIVSAASLFGVGLFRKRRERQRLAAASPPANAGRRWRQTS